MWLEITPHAGLRSLDPAHNVRAARQFLPPHITSHAQEKSHIGWTPDRGFQLPRAKTDEHSAAPRNDVHGRGVC